MFVDTMCWCMLRLTQVEMSRAGRTCPSLAPCSPLSWSRRAAGGRPAEAGGPSLTAAAGGALGGSGRGIKTTLDRTGKRDEDGGPEPGRLYV